MRGLLLLSILLSLLSCQRYVPSDDKSAQPVSQVSPSSTPSPVLSATAPPETIDRRLQAEFAEIAKSVDGGVGIAVKLIETGESAYLDRHGRYPMLSVHKLPIAMAVLRMVEEGRIGPDQEVSITPDDFVRPGYNSPLRYKYPEGVALPLREIIRASISESDGTASDVLLDIVNGPTGVQSYLEKIGISDSIVITESEKSMSEAWENQYLNWATPDATIRLLEALHEGRVGLGAETTWVLLDAMRHAETGERRIMGGLPRGTPYAHKTGTGGTEKGVTSATNDVGLITLPDGRHVAIAVYIRDSKSSTAGRQEAMQRIAEAVWKKWVGAKTK